MSSEKIRAAIKNLASDPKANPVQVLVAKVVSVDWNKRNCKVKTEDGREFFKVRLRAVLDNSKKGICVKPKVDSYVLIGLINNQQMSAFVVMASEVDSIEYTGDDEVVNIDILNGAVTFNGGQNDGMVKVNPLVQKMNDLEDYVRGLADLFNSHTHPVALTVTLQPDTSYTQQLTGTQKNDLENTDVKH